MTTIIRKASTGEAGNAGEFGTHTHDESDVALAVPKEPRRFSYWGGVYAAKDPDATVEDLQYFLETEAEDDYMVVIAGHPNATPEQIERASQHNATNVRQAALDNPNVARATVERIKTKAIAEEEEYRAQREAEGISPMSGHMEEMAATEAGLAMRAGAVLRGIDKK